MLPVNPCAEQWYANVPAAVNCRHFVAPKSTTSPAVVEATSCCAGSVHLSTPPTAIVDWFGVYALPVVVIDAAGVTVAQSTARTVAFAAASGVAGSLDELHAAINRSALPGSQRVEVITGIRAIIGRGSDS